MGEEIGQAVRRATAADGKRMAEVLAAGFSDDPVLSFLLPPGTPRREQRLRRWFELEVARSSRRGGTWIAATGAGAAVWFPPGRWQSPTGETLRQAPGWIRVLGRQLVVAGRVRAEMEAHHRQLPAHWYLLYLGVEPHSQGRGVGSALLRAILDECDRTGTPAYLEATCDRNRALYARHGFVDQDPLPLPVGGPNVFPMWRECA